MERGLQGFGRIGVAHILEAQTIEQDLLFVRQEPYPTTSFALLMKLGERSCYSDVPSSTLLRE